MADFPRILRPAFVTPFRVPPAFSSIGASGKVQLRGALAAGREWSETWNGIKVGTPEANALLAFISWAVARGETFEIDHPYTPGSFLKKNGIGAGAPAVAGAGQTGALLLTDGWTGLDNLASNPGFESGAFDPHVTVASGGTWDVTTTAARGGVFSARYNPTGQNANAEIQVNGDFEDPDLHHEIAPGERVYVRVFHRRGTGGTGANSTQARIAWMDASGSVITQTNGTAVAPTQTDFSEFAEVSGTAPAGTAYFVARIRIMNEGGTSLTLLDDILIPGPAFKAGDVFRVTGLPQLFEVTADAYMQSPGVVAVPIDPPIVAGSSPADDAPLIISGAKLTAYISEPPNLPPVRPGEWLEGLTITFREAL